MAENLLDIKNLTINFYEEAIEQYAVSGLNLSINKGETIALLGESGCGKSLTSLAIMGLLPEAAKISRQSSINFKDKHLLELSEVSMRKIRGKNISMIFQEPMTSLNPVLTIGEQVLEALKAHIKISLIHARETIVDLFTAVGLKEAEQLLKCYPHELSGGMKQRVMIAMAIALEPDLLIADEPTSALDVTVQRQILKLLHEVQARSNMGMLFITHDLSLVKEIADKIAIMYAGHIVEFADKQSFFNKPLHPYTKQLFDSLPNFEKRDFALNVIPGLIPKITQDYKSCRFAQRCPYVMDKCKQAEPQLEKKSQIHAVRCFLYSEKHNIINKTEQQPKLAKATKQDDSAILDIKDVKFYFPIKKGLLKRTVDYVKAVDDVNLSLTKGKTLAIVGESGCGKTTLAKGILQLIEKTSGEIIFNNNPNLSGKDLRRFVQIIFQDPFSSMNPRMRVGDIILEGMRSLNKIKSHTTEQEYVNQLLKKVGLPEKSQHRYPHEFSGGQRQRICIARALAVEPQLIICDEPTSALDVSVQAQILNLLKKLQLEKQLSYVFISHNIEVVAYMADTIAVMKQGKIVEVGDVRSILHTPKDDYTKSLMG